MPIMAKSNDEYTEVKAIKTPNGTEIDYVLSKVDNTYKRTYTATRELEDTPPLEFKSIKPNANLIDYRIYGQTSRNLFDVTAQHTIAYTTCYEYIISGLNPNLNYTCSTNYNQANHSDASLYFGGSVTRMNGVWQNEPKTYTPNNDGEIIILIRFIQYVESLPIYEAVVSGDIWIMVNEGDLPLPYEPYGESVGDLVTSGEHAGEYKVPMTVSNGTDTLTTPIYLPEQIKKVGDEAEYIDYGEQKQHRVRKNLLQNTATSKTINGVTFTVNSDGSVTCNGTASNTTELQLIPSVFSLPIGTYELNGAPTGGEWTNNFKLDLRVSLNTYYADTGNGIQFNILQDETITMCRIVIYSGYTCDNLTFYPMIRKASITDDTYEPYIENTELDVALPALPTVTGTNVLSVGTEVQPSDMYIKGNFKMIAGGGE